MNKAKEAKKLLRLKDKKWSKAIHEKFSHKCAICGSIKNLNAHHLITRSVPEARHDILNGILLCSYCHIFNRRISAHKGSFMFMLWFLDNYKEVANYLKERYGI